ncbi:hypothetical protein [Actinokineospora alba]|uniref:hypothetical protein n=1 Tax=Actinokineospora alba TaxID=504798 RepID=UPI000B86C5C4|nr:hypothetical protein [Actinokineospora alba]
MIAGLFPDAPATGLAKFDLGSIPASVTPPRTWRHAAWFAVAATLLVMVGLTYAAVTLVTNPRKPEVVDALPGLPSYPGLPLELPGDALVSERPSAPAPSSAAPTTASAKPSDRQQLTAPPPGRPTQAPPAATPTAAPLPAGRTHRQRRHGRGLAGRRRAAEPLGRGQEAAAAARPAARGSR